jgi:hypothetical protein
MAFFSLLEARVSANPQIVVLRDFKTLQDEDFTLSLEGSRSSGLGDHPAAAEEQAGA